MLARKDSDLEMIWDTCIFGEKRLSAARDDTYQVKQGNRDIFTIISHLVVAAGSMLCLSHHLPVITYLTIYLHVYIPQIVPIQTIVVT